MSADDANPLDAYSPFDAGDPERLSLPPVPARASSVAALSEEEEIRLLEQRLNILETQVSTQEKQLTDARATGSIEPPPNWPYFYPIIYYDISEISEVLQAFVKQALLGWVCMAFGFALNFLGCLTLLRAGEATDSPGSKIALSALYLFFVVPMALDLTALATYRLMSDDAPTSLGYFKLFIFLGFSTLFQGILALGMESSGSCGLVTMLNLFIEGHGFIGFLALIITGLLSASTFIHYRLLTGLWAYYRGSDEGRNLDFGNVRTAITPLIVDALSQNRY
jgi:hypothetical protein